MQWRKLARSKITSGRSRTRNMLCCGRRKDNGREALDLTASPLRAPPAPNARTAHPPPMVIQGDFRKVSGISSEIFKQIETVENDHDASTAAALEHVERRGEMIVRILDSRHLGRTAGEAAKRFMSMQDAKHTVQFVEIVKRPGQTLGLYIREGNGIDRNDGVFISRIALESAVYNSGCLKVGDEILAVNLVDVTRMSLDDVVIIMSIPRRLVLATRQRKGSKGGQGSPNVQPRAEHKPPPVVVIKRDLREDETDEGDLGGDHRESMRQRHTGDGREMSESRSRLGLGLSSLDSRHSTGQQADTNGLDLYYNSRPPDTNWGYQPPPPVITEQPKSSMQHFQPYERSYPNTLESLAEKVHSFGMSRRMSAGGQPLTSRISSQQSPSSSHYYVQHTGTGSRRIMPRSGSDQHLPQTEYSDYTSITQAGRHSLLRSSLKSGSTLSRYNQRFVDQAAVAAQLAQSKYGTSGAQYGTSSAMRRTRGSLDYSSDTEATSGSRSGYYYYRNQGAAAVPHSTIPTLGRQNSLTSTDITTKFNSLPRDARGSTRLAMNKRFGDRSVSLLQDESDGALSAPEMPSIRRDRDEYRQWLSRTPSTSAIYEQIRASRDVLNQQRAARFTYSAENIHDALKNMESGLYSGYGRPGTTTTLDRHFTRSQQPSIPARSLSTQHITSSSTGLSSSRSPSMRRMRQLLDLDSVRAGAAPSPVPTPSGTLPRGQRQLDINPAEFLKYKIDKPGMVGGTSITAAGTGAMMSASDEPVSGMLWVHLLAGRGLRASTGTSAATTPVTPSGASPSISGSTGLRDLYCVLECDRVHKARTVVRTGDLVFDWDESFELDLVNNRELDLLIYSWDPQYRHKLCYKGSVYLPTLLKSGPIHQLALKIEPRGTLYLRLRHNDSQTLYKRRPLSTLTLSRTTPLFGVDLEAVVNRESKTGGVPGGVATGLVSSAQHNIPIIVKRCVEEVERRGLDIIGLYRLCGSATKKRILREAFERNSRSVDLSPDNVPDINVITGVLKDYLRELPEPLFTKCLYQMMVDALGVCLPDDPEGNAKLMFSILDCLPRINRATLIFLMDHLALVVSASDRNKMSAQNLATALAPPLMLHSNESMTPTAAAKPHHELDYQQPISVLKYLLQIWPTPKHHSDIVGCFNLPHKNSPLQKVPEDPKILDTKFYLFTRNINFSHPEVLVYDDNGASLEKSSFNSSKPLKLLVHGYMGRWNDKGFLVLSEAYRKLYDCNVVVMDWHVGARGPQYTNAAANTELVGRQLGMLLELMVEKGMQPRDMHLIGFSLGAHVCGTASEALKVKGYLVGRITGLDAASPLFRNNYLREKYKKLDRGDAKFVDVIHTDASPFITDGFGLWQPIGHVDFFPNGGQEQPGCTDTKGSIVVTHLEGGLSRDIACSHLRAFFLYTESVLNMLKKKENKDICEFTSFTCPGGLTSFEKGYCFPQIEKNSSLVLDPSYLSDIGRFGEDAKGEGVMYFSTKDSSQYCGTQLQASAIISQQTAYVKGILQLQLNYLNHSVNFHIKCETAHGTIMNSLAVADYGSLTSDIDTLTGVLKYHDMGQEKNKRNQTDYAPVLYIDKLIVRDMFGNSWQYCKKETIIQDQHGTHNLLNITLKKTLC